MMQLEKCIVRTRYGTGTEGARFPERHLPGDTISSDTMTVYLCDSSRMTGGLGRVGKKQRRIKLVGIQGRLPRCQSSKRSQR